ncbi:MAG TPA: 16S rRNA (adenine(1518)-N(6)/adenine(1519)-N(6))-dimethyltransferase RsmA [Anaerolineales bacterium]
MRPEFDAPRLLRRHSIRPLKRLGQHFLVEPRALSQVVSAAELGGTETVLEVGAGLGSLTRALAAKARRVIAVEIDRRLLPPLREVLEGLDAVEIVIGDILEIDLESTIGSDPYLVVANIPYNITSALIRHFLESEIAPQRLVLTVQREVAQRVIAGPGQMSLLALGVRVYGTPSLRARIPARAFYPRPQVDSAVLRVDVHDQPGMAGELLDPVFRLARAGFGQRRKMLKNTLAGEMKWSAVQSAELLAEAGIGVQARPQELDVADWARLAGAAIRLGLLG